MAEKKNLPKIFETRYFGLVIGFVVFLLLFGLSFGTLLIRYVEEKMLDFNFRLKNSITTTRVQVGVSLVQTDVRISPDILIVGIDNKSLDRFGRWPFPRFRHADLVDGFARIRNQEDRERSLFLDIFFSEPSEVPEDDARLVGSIRNNGRVYLETVLTLNENLPGTDEKYFVRQDVLSQRLGTITNIQGDWLKVNTFLGLEAPPLMPYGRATAGYGHANYLPDADQVFRRQPLIVKLSKLLQEIPLDQLKVDEPLDRAVFERLAWIDKGNEAHDVPYPLTADALDDLKDRMRRLAPQKVEDTDGDNKPDKSYYVVRKYRDSFLPAITLSLALQQMHKTMSDIEVVLGKYIRIPAPQMYNVETGQWEPYRLTITPPTYDEDGAVVKEGTYRVLSEVTIPIDQTGSMLINFMGFPSSASPEEHQTFVVRPYSGYAANPPSQDPAGWPPTKRVGNTIVMVGAFFQGADQKPTPFGLMYGVEVHANALNTILMNNFLNPAEPWVSVLILFGMVMLTSLMVSRLSTIWSLFVTIGVILVYFFVYLLAFDLRAYILTFSAPAAGTFLSFLSVVTYRTMTEERDKRRIRDMFGKYVSPAVVEEILANPPELGGVDKELTVFFSDIRGFTTLSESLTPQELVNHLNQYLTAMTDLILQYLGTLDKYVGDEIMCFWGAPLPQAEHALLACKCALKQIEVLNRMNEGWPPEKRISIGIGVNTGIMTVGNMGSMGRMNYTLMGDMVNLGARLEGTNKTYMSTIIISEFTYAQVKEQIIARELDNIRVKGKNKPVLIYELIDVIEGLEPPTGSDGKGRVAAGARVQA